MLPSQRHLFEIPREVCYLNSASYSPLPLPTLDAARRGRRKAALDHRCGFAAVSTSAPASRRRA